MFLKGLLDDGHCLVCYTQLESEENITTLCYAINSLVILQCMDPAFFLFLSSTFIIERFVISLWNVLHNYDALD